MITDAVITFKTATSKQLLQKKQEREREVSPGFEPEFQESESCVLGRYTMRPFVLLLLKDDCKF